MTPRILVRNSCALLGTATLVALSVAPAVADGSNSGDVKVTNTETVQVYQSADGTIDTKRVYEQLSMTGKGSVSLRNPISTASLRNLDGFSGISAKNGVQTVNTKVDGTKKTRSVSTFTGKLPLKITTGYVLNGKAVEPGDVVGKSGRLAVTFTVENTTGKKETISVPDGKGGTIEQEVDVVVPIVGSLTTVAPSTFTNVASKQANLAGDGKGGTKMSFTMTLFPPIGGPTAEFGYTANITDGVVPQVDVSALPVDPLQSPTFASAAKSYQGGADTGAALTDGATQIDANLLKLRDGAADLVSGLMKLNDGADQLSDGLNDTAVPGADKLADGSKKLAAGTRTLTSGTGTLKVGTTKLEGGTGKALAGSKKLTGGLKKISGGLGQLSDQLPSATDGIGKLKAGVDKLIAGLGSYDSPDQTTVLGTLATVRGGLNLLANGSTETNKGLTYLKNQVASSAGGLPDPATSAGDVRDAIAALVTVCNSIPDTDPQGKGTCQARINGTAAAMVSDSPTSLKSKLTALKTDLTTKLTALIGGLQTAIDTLNTRLIPGVDALAGSINRNVPADAANPGFRGGLNLLGGGLDQLAVGINDALAGVNKLYAGSNTAYSGSSALTKGLGQIDTGAGDLNTGAGKLNAGAGKLNDGAGQLSAGNTKLADGLGDAADGSKKIADGLGQAADAAPALPEGAARLSAEGTKKLVAAGQDTTKTYAGQVAVIKAGSARAQTAAMAYGAPEGAVGLTAYSYKIEGLDGEGSDNLARAVGGLAILGAAGGVFMLRRRFI